jgi:DNA-binding protein HU-beta
VNKAQLVSLISEFSSENKATVERVLGGLSAAVSDGLAEGHEITLPDIGKLKPVKKAARQARNPRTGESVEVPARVAAKFVPAKLLRDNIQ